MGGSRRDRWWSGWRTWWRPSATTRLVWGLVSLTLSVVLLLDLMLGIFPSEQTRLRDLREREAHALAVQARVLLIQPDGPVLLNRAFDDLAEASSDILSVGVRRRDGVLLAASSSHEEHWVARDDLRSTMSAVTVPLLSSQGVWGAVEIRYQDQSRLAGWRDWLGGSLLSLMLGLGTLGAGVYYFYLRRMLQHLDPSQAIPDRVRAAFDALTEGLIVLDDRHRVMLVNEALLRLYPAHEGWMGRSINDFAWLTEALSTTGRDQTPWDEAMRSGQPVLGVRLDIGAQGQSPHHVLLNCAAITDGRGKPRGCLVTLDDVTELDRANARLRQALTELESSHAQIQRQNVELEQLANHDPMTGCLNRRSFYARAGRHFTQSQRYGTPLACIMTDIDKFKNFNDTHGHAVGDQVIQQVARVLKTSLRADDLLCRYGGEEFCILLPATTLDEAMQVAQRMRARIEAEAGAAITETPGLRITSSFGVCTLPERQPETLDKLIEQADAGLYAAKESGRNRVCYAPEVCADVAG
ncbi:diguanylate cyclase [Aquabacterium sp. A3]|uniref:sensor domain-containing diguanylate cyclase n=1 Tax=Aquabacterium sp. A3 TaxID=3132829 RepID=UPI00311921D1